MPKAFKRLTDEQVAVKFKRRLIRNYFVRFHMGLILSATTATGLISSKLLLVAGVTSIPVRYPAAVVIAYLVFLGMMRLWVAYVVINVSARPRPSRAGRLLDSLDPSDIDDIPTGSFEDSTRSFGFGGGDSGGAGASDSWGSPMPVKSSSGSGGSGLPSLDIDLDDGIWIVVVLIALVLVIFGAGGYLIYVAPEILPDIAFNALLAGCLTGAVKRAETKGWIHSVFRSTWIPLTLVLLLTIALAVVVHKQCPSAPKLMDALTCEAK